MKGIFLISSWLVTIICLIYLYNSNVDHLRRNSSGISDRSYLLHVGSGIFVFLQNNKRLPHGFSEIEIPSPEATKNFCWERSKGWEDMEKKGGLSDQDNKKIILVRQLRPIPFSSDQIILWGVSADGDVRDILSSPNITEPAVLQPVLKKEKG